MLGEMYRELGGEEEVGDGGKGDVGWGWGWGGHCLQDCWNVAVEGHSAVTEAE